MPVQQIRLMGGVLRRKILRSNPHFSRHGGVAAAGEVAGEATGANRPGNGRIGDSPTCGAAICGEHASFCIDHNRLGADLHRLDV